MSSLQPLKGGARWCTFLHFCRISLSEGNIFQYSSFCFCFHFFWRGDFVLVWTTEFLSHISGGWKCQINVWAGLGGRLCSMPLPRCYWFAGSLWHSLASWHISMPSASTFTWCSSPCACRCPNFHLLQGHNLYKIKGSTLLKYDLNIN